MLVPEMVLVAALDPIQALKMPVPGAATLTLAPKFESRDREPSFCMLATVMMHLGCDTAWAGQQQQCSGMSVYNIDEGDRKNCRVCQREDGLS